MSAFTFYNNVTGGGGGGTTVNYLCLQDQKGNAVDGGTFTSGSWQTRTLNTVQSNSGSILTSLTSNQFTLPAGSYFIYATAPAFACGNHQLRVRDITNTVTLIAGIAIFAAAVTNAYNTAVVAGGFVLSAPAALEIQHFCSTTSNTTGFGAALGVGGEIMVYTVAEIWKLS